MSDMQLQLHTIAKLSRLVSYYETYLTNDDIISCNIGSTESGIFHIHPIFIADNFIETRQQFHTNIRDLQIMLNMPAINRLLQSTFIEKAQFLLDHFGINMRLKINAYKPNRSKLSKSKYKKKNPLLTRTGTYSFCLLKSVKKALTDIFNNFANTSNNDKSDKSMNYNDLKRYFLKCGVAETCDTKTRIYGIFTRFGSYKDRLSLDGFLNFYRDACLDRPEHVWHDLKVFDFNYKRTNIKKKTIKMKMKTRQPIKWREELCVDSKVDALDAVSRWYTARIIVIDRSSDQVRIRYRGWSRKFDEWLDLYNPRIQPYKSRAIGGKKSGGVVGSIHQKSAKYTRRKKCKFSTMSYLINAMLHVHEMKKMNHDKSKLSLNRTEQIFIYQTMLGIGFQILCNAQKVYNEIKHKSLSQLNGSVRYWKKNSNLFVTFNTRHTTKFGANTISLCHKLKKWSNGGINGIVQTGKDFMKRGFESIRRDYFDETLCEQCRGYSSKSWGDLVFSEIPIAYFGGNNDINYKIYSVVAICCQNNLKNRIFHLAALSLNCFENREYLIALKLIKCAYILSNGYFSDQKLDTAYKQIPTIKKTVRLMKCVYCKKKASNKSKYKVCIGCQKNVYCSKKCQKRHWNGKHRMKCSKIWCDLYFVLNATLFNRL